MRFIFTLLFYMAGLICPAIAQDSSKIVHLETLPAEGILLDKGWLYYTGDNPAFAQPGYDDGNWQRINPDQDIHKLPFLKQGVVWFRLHLSIDSNIRKHQLAMSIQQSGATEMYLNGKLIHRFGVISEDPKKIKAYSPLGKPMIFPITGDSEQLLAIRYAAQPGISYSTLFGLQNPGLRVWLNNFERASEQFENLQRKNASSGFFAIGIYFLFAILHLTFFLFFPSQKSNLYFSIYAFGTTLSWLTGSIVPSLNHIALWSPIFNTQYTIMFCSSIMFVTAVYLLFQVKIDWKYYSLLIYGIATVPWTILVYDQWEIPVWTFHFLFMFRIVQISVGAVRKQKKGAWIVAAGAIVWIICWSVFGLYNLFDVVNSQSNLVFMVAQMMPPLAFSIYLSYQFAQTYKSLQQNLSEVKRLSAEKQQILTSQNETLEKQVEQRTVELQHSLQELKSTQSQLIQSEKMASLGELTAGIAHEIQNPLNFVNNFSEVNQDLITEMKSEMAKGNINDAEIIAESIRQNEVKINTHGKRADAIVKGMLQHSRTSSGQKEPTDINALADEYLRLAYHGMRAKDKSFNAEIQTDFDPDIGKIIMIPQDIGRVLLNLYNNAFYAVIERKKLAGPGYEPLVAVATARKNGQLNITVSDNGIGIPEKVKEKIFQPFFTTKPPGQGTGLGLSLSYDIVNAHKGDLKVESKSGEGSEFIIQLPVV